ncbi:hypothetical protein B0H13DRAFT_1974297, partial [Mycena leptocephala]
MAYFNAEAEPFEEAKSDLERKLTKRKSSSLWSRKSLRRTSNSQSQQQRTSTSQSHQPGPAPPLTSPSTSSLARPPPRTFSDHERGESADTVPPMPELPAWYRENSNHSGRYPMHNPVGPRWYQNHHLVPPSNARSLTRPPSESTRMPNLSRSASNSPLPTPSSSSSQMDHVPRSRKTSQTAHDNVDLLDVSDPSSPASFEENNHAAAPRSRTPSTTQVQTTAQNRRKTVTPSPLSQSTSAVHLQIPQGHVSRKLSKRLDEPNPQGPSPAQMGPPSTFIDATGKKDRRSSVLGRIAKRFSITRKPQVAPMQVIRQPMREPSPEKRQPSPVKLHAPDPIKRVPPPLLHQELPSVAIPSQPEPSNVEADRASTISLETELPYMMGRLTVANPDPGSVENTPVQREMSLPPEDRERHGTTNTGPEALVRDSSLEPVASTSMAVPSQQRSSENVVEPEGERNLPQPAFAKKPQPPPPSPPSPKLPAVPFPTDYGTVLSPPPRDLPHQLPEMTADISPLSASSILVNPPTPYTKDMLMPDEPEPAPPPVPSKRSSRDPSPSQVSVTGRETETFRLIRSSSGNVYASSETIRAAGEQWEVVESSRSRGKNKSQDQESDNRREQRRQAKAEKDADPEPHKGRSERSRKRRSVDDSTDRHQRLPIPEALVSRQEDPKGNRPKRDEDRERKAERKIVDPRLDKPQPAPPPPHSRILERNPSKSARPTSEVPTAADMNMMKAREAWDMDRLWKARSMSGMEPNGIAAPPMPPP